MQHDHKPIAFDRATEIIASRLAFFREEGSEPTANDVLLAGHLVGALWANDLLNTAGENWVELDSARTPERLRGGGE